MAAILKLRPQIKNPYVNRCVKNIPAKFHPDQFLDDEDLSFFEEFTLTRRTR